jgi:hypothetical protein
MAIAEYPLLGLTAQQEHLCSVCARIVSKRPGLVRALKKPGLGAARPKRMNSRLPSQFSKAK